MDVQGCGGQGWVLVVHGMPRVEVRVNLWSAMVVRIWPSSFYFQVSISPGKVQIRVWSPITFSSKASY